MRGYYFCPTTILKNKERESTAPKVAEYSNDFGMLDISEMGFVLAYADTPNPINDPKIKLISSSLTEKINKQKLFDLTGVSLEESYLPDWLAMLKTVKASQVGLISLRPWSDGKLRLLLGPQIWGDPKPIYKHHSISDKFNRASLGSDWTIVSGTTWQIYGSTELEYAGDSGWVRSLRYDADTLASDNHFAELDWTYASNAYRFMGPIVRFNSSAETYYSAQERAQSGGEMKWINRVTAGQAAILVNTAVAGYAPHNLRLEVDGDGLSFYEDDVYLNGATDSNISGNTHVGVRTAYATSRADNFLADVLAPPVTGKESSDTGAGADAKATGYPLAQSLRSEMGAGADAGADYPAAASVRDEEGSGVESLLARILAASEAGNGADDGSDFPAAVLTGAEAAAGVESLLARILAVAESGTGLETLDAQNPLAGLLASDDGVGLDALVALVQSFAVMSGDTGLGAEALLALLRQLTVFDNGSGSESIISRLLCKEETVSGWEIASLLASVIGVSETGSAAETSLSLPAIVSGDAGLGSELVFLLKAIIGDDRGKAVEILKYLIETAGRGTDMRLNLRSGQTGRAGSERRAQRRHGRVDLPSKEVGL